MRGFAIAGLATCAAFAACSTDYETFAVTASSTASASSTGSGGAGGAGGTGGQGGGGGHAGAGGLTGGAGGGTGGAPTGVHCGAMGLQCLDTEHCCHDEDAPDPNGDFCSAGDCGSGFAEVSCDQPTDCTGATPVCCAIFDVDTLDEMSCQDFCSGGGKHFACSVQLDCPMGSGTCQPEPKLGSGYSLCK